MRWMMVVLVSRFDCFEGFYRLLEDYIVVVL
jgi:hypothetical protein